MVSQVDHFDTIFVSSEFEALILENSLIKRHQPRYNILLKDDKGYPFIRLDTGASYPRFTLAGKAEEDGARYFGPFGGRRETRLAIEAVCGALKLPICSRQFPRDIGRERPCLNHHIGRCDGFCLPGGPDQTEYRRRIRQAERIFSGHYRQLTAELQTEMEDAAEELNFEKAAALRDRIRAISVLGKQQQVIAGVCADTDVWGIYVGQVRSGCAVLHIEDGNLQGLIGGGAAAVLSGAWRTAVGNSAAGAGGGHGDPRRPADGPGRPPGDSAGPPAGRAGRAAADGRAQRP